MQILYIICVKELAEPTKYIIHTKITIGSKNANEKRQTRTNSCLMFMHYTGAFHNEDAIRESCTASLI